MPTPLPTPFVSPAWPRSSPEMSPPPAPTATIAWRSRVNTDSPNGRPLAGSSRAGPTPKGVKRRRELPASATVWPHPRRPAPAYTHRYYLTLLAEALALAGKIEEGLAALDDALATAAVSGAKGWSAEIHRLRGELTGRLPYPDPAKAEEFVPHRLGDRPRARHAGLRIARRHEPRPAVARAGPAGRGARPARARLRLVHRGLRHRRPERREGAARRTGRMSAVKELARGDRYVRPICRRLRSQRH